MELIEVPFSRRSLDSTDVFILDMGTEAYQWNGRGCTKEEKFRVRPLMFLYMKVIINLSRFT